MAGCWAAAELRCEQIVGEVAESGGVVIEVEAMPDPVRLLVELSAQVAVVKLVPIMWGRSARRLRREFGHLARVTCLWAPLWLVCTVGGAPPVVLRRDVENQKLTAARKQAV